MFYPLAMEYPHDGLIGNLKYIDSIRGPHFPASYVRWSRSVFVVILETSTWKGDVSPLLLHYLRWPCSPPTLQNSQPKCQWNPKTSPDIPLTTYFQPPETCKMRCFDNDASRNLCTPNPPLPVQAWQPANRCSRFGFPTRSILSDLNSAIYRNSPSKFSLQRQDLWNLLGGNGKHGIFACMILIHPDGAWIMET